MTSKVQSLIDTLCETHSLSEEQYAQILRGRTQEAQDCLTQRAAQVRSKVYGNGIFIRGLIEISSFCKNDCLYCGLRRSNGRAERYRLSPEEIAECCKTGYELGFRTFVLQGGEDSWFTDERVARIVSDIKQMLPDCAVTLSLGEKSRETYQLWFDAGADRYLLRHETADAQHYARLHPSELSLENRLRCLSDLRDIGYQTGCGFMVGSPFQTPECLAKDLCFIEKFRPHMVGIGPFIPHKDTPFAQYPAGSAQLTVYLMSILRLMLPEVLLPATTALNSIDPYGREQGILAGGNVLMPNLSPEDVRKKYLLYNGKKSTGAESAQSLDALRGQMRRIGFELVVDRGDSKLK